MQIDIREYDNSLIEEILFAEKEEARPEIATILLHSGEGKVYIVSQQAYVAVLTKQDVKNLIKALNKAIELGWFK